MYAIRSYYVVLGIGVAHHTDRRDTQPQQIALSLGGIALEIAVQLALSLSDRQLIVRLGKMVHADVLIATGGEELDGLLQHGQLLGRCRKCNNFV